MSTTGIEKFKGERLQRALDARRWSVTDLSEYTGISVSMLYHLINNKRKPSFETLQEIASTSNLPRQFFLKDFEHEKAHPFFRKFSRSTKKRRISIEMQIDWLIEIRNYLSEHIDFPKLNIPEFKIFQKKKPLQLTNANIEKIAEETRNYWGVGNRVISSISNLYENNGLLITKFDFDTSDIDALSKYEVNRNNAFIILSRDKDQSSRTRFDLAHELGHCILHRFLNPSEMDLAEKETHKQLEKQANRFAGAFLLPQDTFSRDFEYPTLESFKNLKVKHGVSISFLVFRARQLDLINKRTYKNLQINISRKKWRTEEPLEEHVPKEEPTLMRKALDLLFSEKIINLKSFVNEVGFYPNDIERVCGLENSYLDKYKDRHQDGPNLRLVE